MHESKNTLSISVAKNTRISEVYLFILITENKENILRSRSTEPNGTQFSCRLVVQMFCKIYHINA